jgi:hypothetical protein
MLGCLQREAWLDVGGNARPKKLDRSLCTMLEPFPSFLLAPALANPCTFLFDTFLSFAAFPLRAGFDTGPDDLPFDGRAWSTNEGGAWTTT